MPGMKDSAEELQAVPTALSTGTTCGIGALPCFVRVAHSRGRASQNHQADSISKEDRQLRTKQRLAQGALYTWEWSVKDEFEAKLGCRVNSKPGIYNKSKIMQSRKERGKGERGREG